MERRKLAVGFSLFVLILIGSRILWITAFNGADQPHAVNGQLDLRDWNAEAGSPLTLDGQWEFYPYAWLIEGANRTEPAASVPDYIHVPGSWNAHLNPESREPYGYGTYRLRILVNPEKDHLYSIRVPSVRSSSALYVNGSLLASSGQPGAAEDEYAAGNVPYTASFHSGSSGIIEVVVQAANYKDPRESGIVRSMKFGTEKAIAKQTQLSINMQLMVAVVFLMHGAYALILFFIGNRDVRLLYFFLLLVGAMLMFQLGSDDKLIHVWFPIGYEWGFKLVHLSMAVIAYSLIQCVRLQLPVSWRKPVQAFAIFCAVAGLLALALPAKPLVTIQSLYTACVALSILSAGGSLLRESMKNIKDNVLLLMSLIAFSSHLVWWFLLMFTGIKVVYYPFDLILSTTCFASVWFRRYFQALEESKKLSEKLRRADKLKDEFLANTSHELRNPLHGVLNMSQAVLERERSSLQVSSVKDLETVLSVGRRMSLMLNDLLDSMSLREGTPRLHFRPFSVHAVATGVIDMLQFMTEGKRVHLLNRIPDQFPQVIADENRVIQIVFNLLHNALKYTGDGEVSISGRVQDGRALITVADTGIGMDEETMRRIFEPYEQHDAGQTMVEGGFGLGLSISKQLAELHGGTLHASSVPGQGSEFSFTLQLSDSAVIPGEDELDLASFAFAEVASAVAPAVPSDRDSERQSGSYEDRPRILVVDDDPVNLKVLETILGQEHYEITTVTSGYQALDVLDEKEWDLVISDVMMPRMSGYELSRTIRQRFTIAELPILLLTARSLPKDIENGFLSGANDYVAKPVDPLEMRSRVKALTDVRQSARERLRMEASWLQAQIQPHFLFNTLNSVAALSEIDTERMRKLLETFGHLLRDKFRPRNIDEPVPIEEELSIVRSYLFIEKERYEDRLNVEWELDDCRDLRIPLLTIQPLVENAVLHGIMKRARGGKLLIRIRNGETHAEISVEDDGVGMDHTTLERLQSRTSAGYSGVGLLNTDLRLKRRYGQGLHIQSIQGQGTTISFTVNKS
ncbi:response regulator [Cohnella terricola]|uniref:histidine kinase n=2 Tax=Cohnella terricola TaxID=1289167 RepID=A0A559JTY2_9BACL|nr:ATP-binding protein [Cohnella terricola]TVY03348.1 response regulator [Cohnella terricola]